MPVRRGAAARGARGARGGLGALDLLLLPLDRLLPITLVVLTPAALVAITPPALRAQDYVFAPRAQWEVRVDGRFGASPAARFGAGVNVPAGYYVRLGGAAGLGPARHDHRTVAGAQMEAVARYLLDPFREIRWGLYAGAGLSASWEEAAQWRGHLVALIGLEGPESGRWRTAVELGLGGGLRAGLVMRRARVNGR